MGSAPSSQKPSRKDPRVDGWIRGHRQISVEGPSGAPLSEAKWKALKAEKFAAAKSGFHTAPHSNCLTEFLQTLPRELHQKNQMTGSPVIRSASSIRNQQRLRNVPPEHRTQRIATMSQSPSLSRGRQESIPQRLLQQVPASISYHRQSPSRIPSAGIQQKTRRWLEIRLTHSLRRTTSSTGPGPASGSLRRHIRDDPRCTSLRSNS